MFGVRRRISRRQSSTGNRMQPRVIVAPGGFEPNTLSVESLGLGVPHLVRGSYRTVLSRVYQRSSDTFAPGSPIKRVAANRDMGPVPLRASGSAARPLQPTKTASPVRSDRQSRPVLTRPCCGRLPALPAPTSRPVPCPARRPRRPGSLSTHMPRRPSDQLGSDVDQHYVYGHAGQDPQAQSAPPGCH